MDYSIDSKAMTGRSKTIWKRREDAAGVSVREKSFEVVPEPRRRTIVSAAVLRVKDTGVFAP